MLNKEKTKEDISKRVDRAFPGLSEKYENDKKVINEAELKKRFPFGQWSIESVEDLLETNCFTIQMILPHIDYEYLLHVLYSCSENFKQYVFYNMSGRYEKICQFDLAAESPTFEEQEKAREALVYVSREVRTQLEEKVWQQLMLKLPEAPLPNVPDFKAVFALNEKQTKDWVEKLELEQLIHAMALDDEWHQLYEEKVEPLIRNKMEECTEKELDNMLPQYKWQIEIARRLVAYYAL